MKRILIKVLRFFWSWGFLKFVLWTITIIILFYAEEDWRGAHAWAATKAKWEARGESFDRSKLIPQAVPDTENLAALPLFKLSPDPEDASHSPTDVALKAALRRDARPSTPSLSGNWEKGEPPDLVKLRSDLAIEYTNVFKKKPAGLDALAQLNELYPFVETLDSEAATRTQFRLPVDYDTQPPYALSLGFIADQVGVAQVLRLHGLLAIDQHRPDVALADIRTALQIGQGISHEPMLVAGLVASAARSLTLSVVYRGLTTHAWSDAQLGEIESRLARVDALAGYQLSMRGELLMFSLPTLEYLKKRPSIAQLLQPTSGPAPFYDTNPIFDLWPEGWIDLNAARVTGTLFTAVPLTDPKAHRVFVAAGEKLSSDTDRFAGTWAALAPWNVFGAVSLGPVLNATLQFARAQVRIDEARIACGLERYRLARGGYPSSLDELTPDFLQAMPRDVIDGEPYHYRLSTGGTYLLYSVGWNEKDDGGQAVFSLPPAADESNKPYKHGDWVWPTSR